MAAGILHCHAAFIALEKQENGERENSFLFFFGKKHCYLFSPFSFLLSIS